MRKRISLVTLIVVAVLVMATGTVVALGGYVLPAPDPEEADYVGDGELEVLEEGIDTPRDFPDPPVEVLVHDGMRIPSFVENLVLDLGKDVNVVSYISHTPVEWNSVAAQIASGDFVTISVQPLSSISSPGSQIGADWLLVSVDGFEGAIEQRDDSNTHEAVWILSESYQVGVSLSAEPGERLAMAADESIEFLKTTAASLGKRLDGLAAP